MFNNNKNNRLNIGLISVLIVSMFIAISFLPMQNDIINNTQNTQEELQSNSATNVEEEDTTLQLPVHGTRWGGGDGTRGNPYQITNVTELQNMNSNLNAHYILVNNIDASETKTWNGDQGFMSVGDSEVPFGGALDGKGYTIKHLVINRSGWSEMGLFGSLSSMGLVINVTLTDVKIAGGDFTGALIGNNHGSVKNCYTACSVNGSWYTGGLVGYNSGDIFNCYYIGNVNGTNDDCGGLVGNNVGTINISYSTGKVNGTGYVGGLVGSNMGMINNSYSSANVTGNITVGGLVGFNDDGIISNSYSSGNVSGGSIVGGFLGSDYMGSITNCYWDNETSTLNTSAAGTGKYTKDMKKQATFVGWNFTGAWGIRESLSYPFLLKFYFPDIAITTSNIIIATEDALYSVNYDADFSEYLNYPMKDELGWSLETNSGEWLSINTKTGVLKGTPINNDVGLLQVKVIAKNYNGDTKDFTIFNLDIQNAPPEIITIEPTTSVLEDNGYYYNFDSNDDGQGTITWTLKTNAPWLSINGTTGNLTGTPDNSHVGSSWINVTVNDGNDGIDFINFNIIVNNAAPVITTTEPPASVLEDTKYYFNFSSTDEGLGNTKWSIKTDINPTGSRSQSRSNSNWLSINETTGILSGTPDNSQVGIHWANVTFHDGNSGTATASLNFTITVNNANDPPKITTADVGAALEDNIYSVAYQGADIDPSGDTLTWKLESNAGWLNVNSSTGILSGTPKNNHVGQYWVNISVDDGEGGFTWHNFTLTVKNAAPAIITNDVTIAVEYSLYSVDYVSDDDGLGNITWNLFTNANWLEIDGTTGVLSGTPGISDVGSYWVNVSVKDGNGGTAHSNFTLEVKLADSDEDGMPDDSDQFPDDPTEWIDSDGDGTGNNADTDDDNDGMPDLWEDKYNLDLLDPSDAGSDPDDDGYSNLAEFIAGTDPMDRSSFPKSDDEEVLASLELDISQEEIVTGEITDGSGIIVGTIIVKGNGTLKIDMVNAKAVSDMIDLRTKDQNVIGIYLNITMEELDWLYIEIPYNEADLPAGVDEANLKFYYFDTTKNSWVVVEDSGVNTEDNYIWANVTHLTVFAAMGKESGKEDTEDDGPDNTMAIVGAVLVIVVLLVLAGMFFMRKRKSDEPETDEGEDEDAEETEAEEVDEPDQNEDEDAEETETEEVDELDQDEDIEADEDEEEDKGPEKELEDELEDELPADEEAPETYEDVDVNLDVDVEPEEVIKDKKTAPKKKKALKQAAKKEKKTLKKGKGKDKGKKSKTGGKKKLKK